MDIRNYLVFTTSTGLATNVAEIPATTALKNVEQSVNLQRRLQMSSLLPSEMSRDALSHPSLAHQVVLDSIVHYRLTHVDDAVPAAEQCKNNPK